MEPLRLPGTLDSLARIRDYVDRAAVEAGLEKKARYRLRLAVDEIATNIITYGYEEAGLSGDITIGANIEGDTLTVVLEDTAIPFNPLNAAEPDDLDAPLEERQIGGLGIFLTVQGIDTFRYERASDKNRNIFIMNRPRAASTQEETV